MVVLDRNTDRSTPCLIDALCLLINVVALDRSADLSTPCLAINMVVPDGDESWTGRLVLLNQKVTGYRGARVGLEPT